MNARGILFDIDGVLMTDAGPLPGAAEAVARLRAAGVPCLFATNTTSRPRAALAADLSAAGIPCVADDLWTPAAAAASWLAEHARGPVALLVADALVPDLGDVQPLAADQESGAAAVVVADLGAAWDYATLNRAFRLLMSDARPALVALGMTRYWRAVDGLRLDVAPFVHALEHAAGVEAVVLGKPAAAFFAGAAAQLGLPADALTMIGDDIVTDVGGAMAAGLRGLLVRTGKFRPQDLSGDVVPDAVLESVAELPGWWGLDG